MKKVMVMRFSAMGDVSMVMAAIKQLLIENSEIEVYVLTRKKFAVFFQNQSRVQVINADFENKNKGLLGLIKLYFSLKKHNFDFVFDLHQNLRSRVLDLLFRFSQIQVFVLNKGRAEKKELTKNLAFTPLKHSIQRYLETFQEAGLIKSNEINPKTIPVFQPKPKDFDFINTFIQNKSKLIGIAPFAQHSAKMWPLEKYKALIEMLSKGSFTVLVFGGGNEEKTKVDEIILNLPNTYNLVNKFTLIEEIALLSKIEMLVCNDSANMHMASLMGTTTVSIWGATHSYAGFGVLFQPESNQIQISKEQLACRPCSIYGKKPCIRGDYACLNWITVEMVFEKIEELFNSKQ